MANKGLKGITYEIGGNVVPLNKALQDVNAKTRDLGSELRSVDRLLKLDPNNITLVKQKEDLLNQSITETKNKLDTLKSAQAQVDQQFKSGDIGTEQYRAFQRELESTKGKLESLKDQKKNVSVIGTAFGEVKQKAEELNSKLQPIENGLKKVGSAAKTITSAGIKTVSTAVDVAGKGLKAYTAGAAAAGTAAAGLAVKAASSADDINTLATQTGLSTDQIQKFQYASEVIDVPLETLTGSMAKLTKNMATAQGGTGSAAEAFKTLGVSITDQNGQLRNNQDVFNDAANALGKMENGTQRDALAMQIFGKSAQDLNPLILGGADTLKQLGDKAQASGLILSQNALDDLNKFRDGLDVMKASAGQAGNVIAGSFAGGLTSAVSVINSSLPSITSSLAGLFSPDTLAASQEQLTSGLTNLTTNLVTQIGAQLPTLLDGFNAVIISVVTAVSAALPGVVETILPALITGLTNLVQGLLPEIPILLPVVVDGAVQLFMGLLNGLNQIIPQLMAMLPTLVQNVSQTLIQNLPLIIKAGIQLLTSLILGITKSIPQLITATIALIPVITKALLDNLPALINAGIQLIVALATGLPKAIPAIIKALPQIIEAIINGFISVNWGEVGIEIIKGIGQGLVDGVLEIGDLIKKAAKSLLNRVKDAMGIHSPSTLFRDEVGTYLAEGLGIGFVNAMDSVSKQMQAAIPTDFNIGLNSNIAGINGLRAATATTGSYSHQNNTPVNFNIKMGDIVVKGNADQNAIQKIKNSQQKQIDKLKKWQDDFEREMAMLPLQFLQMSTSNDLR